MLGIFDSGLGGLTVLLHVREELPGEDLLYYADQAHVPYGDKNTDELRSYLTSNIAYLQRQGVDAIVMGCNTSCAIAAQFGYPPADVPILDLIEAAAQAVAQSGALRVGVVATAPTVRSGAYAAAIHRLVPGAQVQEVAAPALVPLVEAGHRSGPLARAAVADACSAFVGKLDAVVLACTHYPLLDSEFAAVLGPGTVRIDPSVAQAKRAVAFVRNRGAQAPAPGAPAGRIRYVTSGDLTAFRANLREIVGPSHDVEDAEEDVHRDEAQQGAGDDLQRGVRFQIHT
ncbi:MAG TPA: glutamate racemase [Candidatus Baltobacteraceae bacterium]